MNALSTPYQLCWSLVMITDHTLCYTNHCELVTLLLHQHDVDVMIITQYWTLYCCTKVTFFIHSFRTICFYLVINESVWWQQAGGFVLAPARPVKTHYVSTHTHTFRHKQTQATHTRKFAQTWMHTHAHIENMYIFLILIFMSNIHQTVNFESHERLFIITVSHLHSKTQISHWNLFLMIPLS
jgi:hypothetical protein